MGKMDSTIRSGSVAEITPVAIILVCVLSIKSHRYEGASLETK